jgi:serine protease Do
MISGRLSEQRSGFPSALQHDLYLKPEQCGGPLVDLDGKVVGINIARSGRIESLAIPAPVLIDLLKNVAQGRFHIPEADDLQKEITKMNDEKKKLEEDVARIKQLEEKLGRGLGDAQKRLDALLGTGSDKPADKPEEKKPEAKPAEPKK